LLDVLRGELGLTGTKCGCKEGECGACAVLIDGKLFNSCLVAMGSIEGKSVTTIEGYSKTEQFAALDKAYEAVSAVQCGFCIPAMMIASEHLLAENPDPTEDEIRVGISGNLCRCTGYNAIVRAIGIAANEGKGLWKEFLTPATCTESSPKTLNEALSQLKDSGLTPYSGGTDLMVAGKNAETEYLYITGIPELRQIKADDEFIRFGAACTFAEAIKHPLTPSILKDACTQIAAPAIRNAGTLGGNIANGSAKADSALVFMATDSKLRLVTVDSERIIPIKDFYIGGSKTALKPNELIAEILMPKHGIDNYCFKKVGARNALAISRISFAGILNVEEGVIKNCTVAFGAVIDVIIRFGDIDNMLIGKTIAEAKGLKDTYIAAYNEAIVPRRGRVGIEYRKDVCMNLLRNFLESNGI
jgi:xanthine dehydrogenase iron-sulfur cluster and FAD-binding subunit A